MQIIGLLTIFTLFFLFGCLDAPQRTRLGQPYQTMADYKSFGQGFEPNSDINTNSNSEPYFKYNPEDIENSNGSSNGSNDPYSTTDYRFQNCNLSLQYRTADIGEFAICQSANDETLFKFKFSSKTNGRNCLIPITREDDDSSTYLGQPQCVSGLQNNVEIVGTLSKSRQGYESKPINGVIIMKEHLLQSYYSCMNAYFNYRSYACPNGTRTPHNPYCPRAASMFMNEVCMNFKSRYENYYKAVRTR